MKEVGIRAHRDMDVKAERLYVGRLDPMDRNKRQQCYISIHDADNVHGYMLWISRETAIRAAEALLRAARDEGE